MSYNPLGYMSRSGNRIHLVSFVGLLSSTVVGGGLAGAKLISSVVAFGMIVAAYICWVAIDLRFRGVRGGSYWGHLAVALIPGFGPFVYHFLTRGLGGVAWLILVVGGLSITAFMSALLGAAIAHAGGVGA